MHVAVQCKIAAQRAWLGISKGIEITEFEYRGLEWSKPRRMIAMRQKVAIRPNASGKQLRLFEDDIEINGYRYSCYVTTLKPGPSDVWRLYRGRANCENRVRELKYDYGLDKINRADFEGMEAALLLMTVACNFLSLFKQVIIERNVRSRLKTLRYKILAIPSIIEQSGDKIVVNMALQMNRQNWIRKLCDRIQSQYDGTS